MAPPSLSPASTILVALVAHGRWPQIRRAPRRSNSRTFQPDPLQLLRRDSATQVNGFLAERRHDELLVAQVLVARALRVVVHAWSPVAVRREQALRLVKLV